MIAAAALVFCSILLYIKSKAGSTSFLGCNAEQGAPAARIGHITAL